jgi:hypothetical protein
MTDYFKPVRVQRKRTKGWKMPENTISVTRPGKWSNPFPVGLYGLEGSLQRFSDYIGHPNSPHGFELEEVAQLKGKNLACWCPLDQKCHADILLKMANAEQEEE